MSDSPIVLLHGIWHGSWCWSAVTAELTARGHTAVAVDMAGHGMLARRPVAASARPFDPAAFATEPAPTAGVDLDEAAELLISQLKQVGGGRPCVLVAHSMGGVVATRVIQQAPELVERVVYVTAFMPASDRSAAFYTTEPENEGDAIPSLVVADPSVVGALRLDVGATDPAYRDRLRQAFYNDVDPNAADAAMALLSSDAPIGICVGETSLTASAWGSVPRTYVLCSEDNIMRMPLQRRFVAEADAAFPDNPTVTVELESSHSPMLSMPDRLADVIVAAK